MVIEYDPKSGRIINVAVCTSQMDVANLPSNFVYLDDAQYPNLANNWEYAAYENGQIVYLSYLTASYANGTLQILLNNPSSSPPATATVTIDSWTQSLSLTNNTASMAITMHPSLEEYSIPVSISANGCIGTNITVGGTQPLPIPIQVVTPSGGTPTIGPASNVVAQWLQQYYAINNMTIEALLTNTFTALNVLYDTVFNIILPALQQSTYTPVSLTANQQNALSAIKSDVLANLVTTLTNGYPSGASSPQMQFGAFLQNWEKASQNVQAFMNDLALFA